MRRKKDDKRVLRSGNGRQNKSGRFKLRRNNARNRGPSRPPRGPRRNNARNFGPNRPPLNNRGVKQKRKANKTLVFLMVLALIAFVIGAGIGVSLSFDDGGDEGPHYKNVTKEMTSNLNSNDDDVYYDYDADTVDFNENDTQMIKREQT